VARKASAGKKSQCPACEQIYIVPDPPQELAPDPPKDSRRIEIATDDLALRIGLPFPVGKLEPVSAAPPQPRFLHSPSEIDEVRESEPPLPAHILPKSDDTGATTAALDGTQLDESPLSAGLDQRNGESQAYAGLANGYPGEAAAATEWPRVIGSSASREASSSAPTAAAIPQMPLPAKPASVGELQVVSGNCCGQRIRLDFHHFVVGAERDCDLRPSSPLLSRHHCVFKKDEYALRVRDLGSTNGTFVNGRRIFSEAILKPGDEVTVADVTLHVFLPRSPEVIHSKADSEPSISDFVIL
jgi:hypothetical protein